LEKQLKDIIVGFGKHAEANTAEMRHILGRITDGLLSLDCNLTFTYVNQRAGEILGYSPEKMIGKNIFRDFAELESKLFNEACLQSFTTQQYVFFENEYSPKNIWLENNIYPSPDGLTVFFKDVTSRKKVENDLRESELHYRHLIHHIQSGFIVYGPDTGIVLSNQEASKLLGMTCEQLLGKKAHNREWTLVSEDGRKLDPEEYPANVVIKTGESLNNVICGINNPKRQGTVWVLINAFPEFDDSHKLKQVLVSFVDITDRKKAEEELKRSEEVLNLAQSMGKIGSWEMNLATRELKWSQELYRIFELEGTPDDELYEASRKKFHPEDLQKLDQAFRNAVETGKGSSYQHRIITKNGSLKHILGIGETILNEKGEVTIIKGTGQDITEMVKAEEKLQHSYEQIKELVTHLHNIREQERTNMAREIHDELGQQLTGLKMYISSLNKKINTEDPSIKEKFIAAMELIEHTIKSVRKISMELRPSMLDDLGLLAALEWQSSEFEKRFGIRTEFINLTENREIPPRLNTGLFRIFQESLTNVARHAEAKKIVSSLKFEQNKLILTITDDGKGFTVRNIETKKTLGLFGMKERTLEMGGMYQIKSSPGKGTTVSVMIPLNGEVY
jgi:PAS domain S-box-containing protein